MATIIDSLLITMGVDSNGVKSGMARAENVIASSAKSIINNILTPLAAALAMGSAFKEYMSGAQAIAALSDTLGVGQEDAQAWGEAVSRAGGSVEGLNGTLSAINAKMLEFSATGSSSAAPVLAQLGISARNANGSIKSSIDILQDLAGAAGAIDPKRFQAIAGSLGVDSGTLMLLKQGSISVQELVARQKALGVYTKEDSAVALKMANAFKDLLQVFKSVSSIVMRQVIPPLSWLTGKMVDLVVFLKEHDVFLRGVIVGIAAALTATLLPAILRVGAAMLANPLTWIFVAIAAVVISVAAVIEDLYVYMKGGNSALASFWSMFGSGEGIAAKLNNLWTKTKEILGYIFDIAKALFPYVIKYIGSVISVVGSLIIFLANLWNYFKALFSFDGSALSAAFDGLVASLYNVFASVGKLIVSFLDLVGLKDVIISAWQTVRDFFVGFLDWLSEKLGAILDIPGKIKDKMGGFADGVLNFFGGGKANDSSIPAISPADSLAPSVVNNTGGSKVINSSSNVSVGSVNIQTNATDAKTIAREIPAEIGNSFDNFIPAANTGMFVK